MSEGDDGVGRRLDLVPRGRRLSGDGPAPVVILHGGPGAAHDYVEPMAGWPAGRSVLYDQIGCGRSQHMPDAPADFWTPTSSSASSSRCSSTWASPAAIT